MIPQVCPAAVVVTFGCTSIFSTSSAGVGMATSLVPATVFLKRVATVVASYATMVCRAVRSAEAVDGAATALVAKLLTTVVLVPPTDLRARISAAWTVVCSSRACAYSMAAS